MITLDIQLLGAGLALLIAIVALVIVRRVEKGNQSPTAESILSALEKYAASAVAVSAKMAEGAILDGKAAFDAIDKKAAADNCYALLPTTIHVGEFALPLSKIKLFVSQAQWEDLVQRVSNEIDVQFLASANYLASKVPGVIAQGKG
jgi:hypothetical protein